MGTGPWGCAVSRTPITDRLDELEKAGAMAVALYVLGLEFDEGRNTMSTWTFMGHWDDSDELVLEYYVDGEVEDPRKDCGRWQGGLFSDFGTGATPEEAWDEIRREYDGNL